MLGVAAPAELEASNNSLLSTAAFAYAASHPVRALPAAVIERVAHQGTQDFGDVATLGAAFPPSDAGVVPRQTPTRGSLCDAIVSVARANDLPVSFLANLIWQESNFDAGSISRAGAQGIAQFMPHTAAEFGLLNPFEPIHALFAAGKFLRQLNHQFGNLGLAAAAYNAGPRRVMDWLGRRSALPGETRSYVQRITGRPAEQWTSADFVRGPEAALMPPRAPCYEAVEEIEAQTKVVHVAKLMAELTDATKPPAAKRDEPDVESFDEKAWALATAEPGWRTRTMTMVRQVLSNLREKERREASAAKIVTRAWNRIADRTLRKAAIAFANLNDEKAPAVSTPRANGPARRARFASSR